MAKAAIIKLSEYKDRVQAAGGAGGSGTGGLDAEKVAKDSIEVEKKSLTSTEILNKSILELAKIIKEQNKLGKITDKASGTKFYGGAGGAVKERVESIKEFFTLRGFLDKTGIVQKGSTGLFGGIADKALERREAKQQYVKDMMKTDPTVRLMGADKAKEVFEKRFDKSQKAGLDLQENEKELSRLRSAGLTEDQIKRSPEYKKKAELEATLAKVDPRFRGKDTIAEAGGKESKGNSNVIPLRDAVSNEASDSSFTSEEEAENLRLMDEQTQLLRKIEENTRPGGKGAAPQPEKQEEGGLFDMFGGKFLKNFAKRIGGSLLRGLGSLASMIGEGIMAAGRFLLNPAFLGKLVTRIFPIALIVGALVNGLWDGIKTWLDGGSLGDAIIAGLGGILEFLSFGLFDKETIKNMVDAFTGFVTTYITEPIGNFFKNIKDAVVGFFENIGIPEIGFEVFGKKIAFGPWYPFKPDDKPKAPEAPSGGNQGARVEGADKPQGGAVQPADKAKVYGDTYDAARSEGKSVKDSKAAAEKASKNVVSRSQTLIANEPVVPGQPLSDKQMSVMEMSMSMGNKYPPEIMEQYEKQKKSKISGSDTSKVEAVTPAVKSAKATDVYRDSANVQAAKEQPKATVNTVVAPQTNVNNTSQPIAAYYGPKNTDTTMNDYVRRRGVG